MCESKQYFYKIPAMYQRYDSINQVQNLFTYCSVKNLIVTQVSNPALFFSNHFANSLKFLLLCEATSRCVHEEPVLPHSFFFFVAFILLKEPAHSIFFRCNLQFVTQNITNLNSLFIKIFDMNIVWSVEDCKSVFKNLHYHCFLRQLGRL